MVRPTGPQLPGHELVGDTEVAGESGPERSAGKTESQLAAEQLLIDSMIAQQLLEQQLSDREA